MTEASLVDDSVYSLRIYLQRKSKGYMELPLTGAETESAAAAMPFWTPSGEKGQLSFYMSTEIVSRLRVLFASEVSFSFAHLFLRAHGAVGCCDRAQGPLFGDARSLQTDSLNDLKPRHVFRWPGGERR